MLNDLFPYIWPKSRNDIKSRIIIALIILILAKVLTVLVPYTYKWATDAIVGDNTAPNITVLAISIWLFTSANTVGFT